MAPLRVLTVCFVLWAFRLEYIQGTYYIIRSYEESETRTNYHTCCMGWKGSRCDIPICSPKCQNNAICVSPNTCYCLPGTEGHQCDIATCSASNDCYPGTCRSGSCLCTSGFGGNNCEKILDGPDFQRCSATLVDLHGDSFSAKCGPPGRPDKYTYYTNKRDVKEVKIYMETKYVYPGEVPYKPSYMPSSEVGNVESYAMVHLRRKDGSAVEEVMMNCDDRVKSSTPFAAAECSNRTYAWDHAIGHEYRFEINMYAKSGGYKDINNPDTNRVDQRLFKGVENNQTIVVIFDILDPMHCHEDLSENCTEDMPPVLSPERVMYPNITIECVGWNDDGTGLLSYTYQVYRMGLNSLDQFQHSGEPIFTQKIDLLGLTTPFVNYTLPEPGRYSAVLTVTDRAGNTKKARSLILFDDSNKIAIRPNKTITLQNAVKGTDHLWLTNFTKGGPTEMTALLAGVFHNPYHIEHSLLNEVEPLGAEWGYEDTFGNLTTDSIFNFDGITGLDFGCDVHQTGGKHLLNHPPTLEPLIPVAVSRSFRYFIDDGYTVVLVAKAFDAVGDSVTQEVKIHVDSTPPVVRSAAFTKNVNATDQEETPYASRLGVVAYDFEGGIGEVEYEIFQSSTNKRIGQGILRNFKLPNVNNAICKVPTSECFCTKLDECFPKTLPVAINNCFFRNDLQESLTIRYTVRNGALLETQGPEEVKIEALDSVYGLHEYPAGHTYHAVNISDKHVDLLWSYPKSCHIPTGATVTYGISSEYHVDYPKNFVKVKGLVPEKKYTIGLIIRYDDKNSATKEIFVTTKPEECLGKGCETSGLGAGAIAGIAAASLCILVLAIIVLACIRWNIRGKQPVIPETPRMLHHGGVDNNTQQNVYNDGAIGYHKNDAYVSTETGPALMVSCIPGLQGTEEDIYNYGDMETDANATWKHTGDQVMLGDIIFTGRFAEIKKATLNKNQTVVAKTLKAKATSEDLLLMKAKMNFLATSVPEHVNLVNLIGAVPSDSPVILLEYCDQTLKDWLKSQDKVTEQVEDNMINFSTHVARAMAHLAENHIVHRRLGLRNILLMEVNGCLNAKVTGFGPMKTEVEGTNPDKEKIPSKWMAPEQISGNKGERRIYNEKTDIWTYGITVWEIFDKGGSPYREYKHGDLKDLHQSGYRLPKPDYGPKEMYEDVMLKCWAEEPQDRPTFGEIVGFLDKRFNGSPGDGVYY